MQKASLAEPIIARSRSRSETEAVKLIAFASAVFPDVHGRIGDIIFETVIETGVSFAVNARRCLEATGCSATITQKRYNYSLNKPYHEEKDLKRALNGLIHAKSLKIHHVMAPEGVYENHDNSLILHFVYETDRYPETYVDIFGMAWAFLTQCGPSGETRRKIRRPN